MTSQVSALLVSSFPRPAVFSDTDRHQGTARHPRPERSNQEEKECGDPVACGNGEAEFEFMESVQEMCAVCFVTSHLWKIRLLNEHSKQCYGQDIKEILISYIMSFKRVITVLLNGASIYTTIEMFPSVTCLLRSVDGWMVSASPAVKVPKTGRPCQWRWSSALCWGTSTSSIKITLCELWTACGGKRQPFLRRSVLLNMLKLYSHSGHPRCRWVCFFIRFAEM